ncbi:MAG: serine hydrolase domain-containing protein [Candidatus Tyrphobacter sp.]
MFKRSLASLLFIVLASANVAWAQAPAPAPALTAADLQSFFAGLVPYALQRGDMAGGVVVVVHDGHIVFAHGYGYANVKKRTPVDPARTLFRVGSVSKLFTWTSVMQLVQAHKIDLNADVNDYLDFRIPEKYGPITMHDLMTHTPGFSDVIRDLFVPDAKDLFPLREYLAQNIPPEIYPPGKIVAYSNYGAALAGYIVQRVSGEPFATYVQQHILTPLHMTDSTFVQPLPARMQPNMASGYSTATSGTTIPFELVEAAPAGAFTSTGDDMAQFMMAQLGNGTLGNAHILSQATARLMHSRAYTLAVGLLNGFDLGFYQENRNGQTIIGHAGDTDAFHSDLHLILSADTGLFMSFNSAGKAGASEEVRTAIFRAFLDRYYPYTAPREATVANPKPDAARVAGYYISSRRPVGLALFATLGQAKVTALPKGTITVSALTDYSGTPKVWREVGPLDYREVGGQTHLRFATDSHGNIEYFATDDFIPVMLFMRMNGLEAGGTLNTLATLAILVFALAIVIWLGGWILRAIYRVSMEMTVEAARWRLAARWGAVAFLVMIYLWIHTLQTGSANAAALFNLDSALNVLYAIGVLAALGGIAMVGSALRRLFCGPGGIPSRIGEIILGLAGLYGLWAIFAFGLASFNYHY